MKKSYTEFSFSNAAEAFAMMPKRAERSCKGDFGRVLCVCGSKGMAGAGYLCAKSAYRMGAGLVEIFTHESNRVILQTLLPEAIVSVWDENYSPNELTSAVQKADCIVAGCGLGTSKEAQRIISDLVRLTDKESTPLILDADALNIISRSEVLKKYTKGAIITPHAKEMSRLCGKSVEDILPDTAGTCYEYAAKHQLICVLKDHNTAVSDGSERVYINTSGNSGLSTGGSGDVLAGMLAGLLAQRKNSSAELFDTVALGVYIHGLCGDLASERLSEYCVMASDVIDCLPDILKLNIRPKSY